MGWNYDPYPQPDEPQRSRLWGFILPQVLLASRWCCWQL